MLHGRTSMLPSFLDSFLLSTNTHEHAHGHPLAHTCLRWELPLQPPPATGVPGSHLRGLSVPLSWHRCLVLRSHVIRLDPEEPSLGTGSSDSVCSLENMSCDLKGCGWPPWCPGILEIKKEDLEQKIVGWQTQRGPGWGVPTARQPKLFSYSEIWRTRKQPFINSSMAFSQVKLDFSHLHPLESSLKPCKKKKIHWNIHSECLFLMELKWFLFFLGCMARDSRSFHLFPRSFSGRRKSEKQMFF